MMKKYFIYIILCANILTLCGCGIKPPYVDPPEGAEHSTFPNTYPDLGTDPKHDLDQ